MSKWKGTYDSCRIYNSEWEKEYPWLSEARDGSRQAFCKVCVKILQPRKSTIKGHAETKDHKQRVKDVSTTRPGMFARVRQNTCPDKTLKKAELQLAMAVACHSSIAAIDHIGQIVKINGSGSPLERLKLHRTKCSMLIKNVISTALEEELSAKLKGVKYCLLVDETTDVSSEKCLCVCVRFFDEVYGDVITAFLGLAPVVETTGEQLFEATMSILRRSGLAIENCMGYSSDGAANMTGEHNSLWSRVKAFSPSCIKMPCMCHSLALCAQKAFDKLPSNLGFMLVEIPKWFKKSNLRREAYKILFDTMNTGDERSVPLPFLKMSTTRWLVRGRVLYNILVNWEELKAYFQCASLQGGHDCRYKARALWEMLSDDSNYLYFVFASPVITEVEKVNALFQSTSAIPSDLLGELDLYYNSLLHRIYDHEGSRKAIDKVEFGMKFSSELKRLIPNMVQQNAIRQRCLDMLVELVMQVKKRMPENRDIFKGLSKLSPEVILTHVERPAFNDLPFVHLITNSLEACEDQYRRILFHPWSEEPVFSDGIPHDPVKFWAQVKKFTKNGSKPYEELAGYALSCLTTPVSNAVVERVFSHVNAVKTKVRNRMSLTMLQAILRIQTTLIMTGKCCKDLSITDRMVSLFTTDMYDHKYSTSADDDGLSALFE